MPKKKFTVNKVWLNANREDSAHIYLSPVVAALLRLRGGVRTVGDLEDSFKRTGGVVSRMPGVVPDHFDEIMLFIAHRSNHE